MRAFTGLARRAVAQRAITGLARRAVAQSGQQQSRSMMSLGGGGYMMTGHRAASDTGDHRILVTGACGQVGQELVPALREKYGTYNVIATDVRSPPRAFLETGPFQYCDVCVEDSLNRIALENGVDTIVHLAAMLSATGERNPQLALKVNNSGLQNVLELARLNDMRVFCPSTIAVFGPTTPRDMTPDECIMRPTTMYGVTKTFGEMLGEYYHEKFGVDFRSLRYPGVISSEAMPGGGTTDYAVEIYYEALLRGKYKCFLDEETVLPMLFMPDLLKGTLALMEAPEEQVKRRVYNIGAMSFTPQLLEQAIKKAGVDFEMSYEPDFRQAIADTWPKVIDDSNARADWGWNPEYDIDKMTVRMLEGIKAKLAAEGLKSDEVGVDVPPPTPKASLKVQIISER